MSRPKDWRRRNDHLNPGVVKVNERLAKRSLSSRGGVTAAAPALGIPRQTERRSGSDGFAISTWRPGEDLNL